MKRIIGALLAVVMAVGLFTVATGADSIEKTAKKTISIGSSYTLSIPAYDAGETLDVKIVMPKTGNLTLAYTHYAAEIAWNLFDENGHVKQTSKSSTSAGESTWTDGNWPYKYLWNNLDNGMFVTKWNSISEKAIGDVTYKLDKGTYYFRFSRTNEGISDLKLKITAKDLDGKTIGGTTTSTEKAAKSVVLTVSLEKGKTLQLGTAVTPSDSTSAVTWTSSNTSVASVSKGTITAKAKGTATITCKVGDVSAKIKVKVT